MSIIPCRETAVAHEGDSIVELPLLRPEVKGRDRLQEVARLLLAKADD